jgi:hypothetical protein
MFKNVYITPLFLNNCTIKHRFDWQYLTLGLTCHATYVPERRYFWYLSDIDFLLVDLVSLLRESVCESVNGFARGRARKRRRAARSAHIILTRTLRL